MYNSDTWVFWSKEQPSAHLYLRAIENLWGFFVKYNGLAVDVAGQAAGHAHDEDEEDVGGHRGRVFTPGAPPSLLLRVTF